MFLELVCKSPNHIGAYYKVQIRFEWIKVLNDKGYIITGDGTSHLLDADSINRVQEQIDNLNGKGV